MSIGTGQERVTGINVWDSEWSKASSEGEIRMGDFYGLRQWILKYVPRYGTVLEAGCGLGRYVFYLNELGIDCIGIESSSAAIGKIYSCKRKHGLGGRFCQGDVKSLPLKENSMAAYVSLGVIEHFREGPQEALEEAYRVLRPGGIAIISTPSFSFSQIYLQYSARIKRSVISIVKAILNKPVSRTDFFQYWYGVKKLRGFVQNAGFKIITAKGADLLYSFYELGYVPKKRSWFTDLVSRLENTFIANVGAQSITISYKPAPTMHCFICGKLTVKLSTMHTSVPICDSCVSHSFWRQYKRDDRPFLSRPYLINPDFTSEGYCLCEYCGKKLIAHPLFGYYGFAKKTCRKCLKDPLVNMELCSHVQPIWRKRN